MAINWMEPLDKIIKSLKISGLWLDIKSSSKFLIAIAAVLHIIFVEIFMVLSIAHLLLVHNIEDFSEAVGIVPFQFVTCIRTLHFVCNKNKIESIVKGIKDLIEHETWIEKQNGSKLKQRIRQIYRIFRTFLASVMTGLFVGLLISLFTHKLSIKMWFPYDYSDNEVLFWLRVAYQVITSNCVVPITIMTEIIPIFFMCYLTGIIEELCERMGKICDVKIVKIVKVEPKSDLSENEKLVGRLKVATMRKNQAKVEPKAGTSKMNMKKPEKDENLKELLKCVEIQQKIKSLTSDVGDVFGRIIWFQGFMSTLVLCFSAFSLTVVSSKALKFNKFAKLIFLKTGQRTSSSWTTLFSHDGSNSANPSALLLCQQSDAGL
jgi:7tm Odorant receptor